jgi:hypothetical protein
VIVLRTFSKAYGLAGLRIGYAVAGREGIALLHKVRQPFNVNAMAQAAALAALADEDHVERTRRMVAEGLAQLEQGLRQRGRGLCALEREFYPCESGEGPRNISRPATLEGDRPPGGWLCLAGVYAGDGWNTGGERAVPGGAGCAGGEGGMLDDHGAEKRGDGRAGRHIAQTHSGVGLRTISSAAASSAR